MRLISRDPETLFWQAFLLSIALHFAVFWAGRLPLHFHPKHTVEIDITNMGHIGSAMTAPRRAAPTPPPPKPAAPVKQWVAPTPDQKAVPAPVPTQPVAPTPEEPPPPQPAAPQGPTNGEYGIGTGEGGETQLSRLPQLLNLSDLSAILRRFYPEQARREGREATVVMDIHIDTDGHVSAIDIVKTGGADFDAAAEKVGKLLRFTPAFLGSQRVGVKMRQAIRFKLED